MRIGLPYLGMITPGGQQINLDTYFDTLNLQSNTESNFVLASGAVSQWNDLSGSGRHATQATASERPLLTGLDPTFDGFGDYLQLASEFSLSTYSAYFVFKCASVPVSTKVIAGGSTIDHWISLGQGNNKALIINNVATTSGQQKSFGFYGEEYYCILSIRRNAGGLEIVRLNNRFLRTTQTGNTAAQAWGRIGVGILGKPTFNTFQGVIKAVCFSSEYFTNEIDTQVTEAFFARYNLPEVSNALTGFGDSITVGVGATNSLTGGFLPLLATQLGRPRKNIGIGGSTLTAVDSRSGVNRYATQLIEAPYSDTIIFMYGTNDITQGVSTSDYQAALETVLNGIISAGYDKSKIIVGTIPYRQGNDSASTVVAYNTVITNTCASLGLPEPADVYNSMLNGGGDLLMFDLLHPNDDGHAVIRDAFAARLT